MFTTPLIALRIDETNICDILVITIIADSLNTISWCCSTSSCRRIDRMLTETNGHRPERFLLRRPVSCSASSSPPTTATAIQFLLSRNAVPRVRTQGPYLARVRTSLLNWRDLLLSWFPTPCHLCPYSSSWSNDNACSPWFSPRGGAAVYTVT